jgi:hypothetical protein
MPENGNCGETPPPSTSTNTPPPGQEVLGTRQSSPEAATAPNQAVLGERAGGTTPAATSAPATSPGAPVTARQTRTANANRTLPFTGTDALAVVLAGLLMLLAGVGLRRMATSRL